MGLKKWLTKKKGKKAINATTTTDFNYTINDANTDTVIYDNKTNCTDTTCTIDTSRTIPDSDLDRMVLYMEEHPEEVEYSKGEILKATKKEENLEDKLVEIAEKNGETKILKKLPPISSDEYQGLINAFSRENTNRIAVRQGKPTKMFAEWLEKQGYEVD